MVDFITAYGGMAATTVQSKTTMQKVIGRSIQNNMLL